jgi:hypothetical protein
MQVIVGVVVPLLVFAALSGCFWFLLSKAQRDPNFDISQVFREDGGKVSMSQVLKGGGFVFHTMATIIVIATIPADALLATVAYGGTWGPVGVAMELVRRKWPAAG